MALRKLVTENPVEQTLLNLGCFVRDLILQLSELLEATPSPRD